MNIKDLEILNHESHLYPEYFNKAKVLELGSRNINGTVKVVFKECEFIGVDWVHGKDVDVVKKFHETKFGKEYFDTIISYSSFEHDPHWKESIKHNLKFLKKGGMLFFNWGGLNSSPHGTHYSADLTEYNDGIFKGTKEIEGMDLPGGYFPKSMDQMVDYLKELGVEVLSTLDDHRDSSGQILFLTGKK